MLIGLVAALGLSAGLVDDLLPRTLGEDPAAVEPQSRAQSRRAGPARPFFDFERAELGGWIGIAQFSGEFEADPEFAAGVIFRVPLGKLGAAGLWAELLFTAIDRDLDDTLYDELDGAVIALAAGLDYGLVDGESFYVRPQVGFSFVSFGDVEGTDDGLGVVLGAVFGTYVVKLRQTVTFSYNPQLFYDGEDWVLFHAVGFNVRF
ncbi:MAG TPA: hypothetical protein VF950_12335 [Planctomycetota bacterium]